MSNASRLARLPAYRPRESRPVFGVSTAEHWRPAMEGYAPRAVGFDCFPAPAAARAYVDALHHRIHPVFSDSFLESRENAELAASDTLDLTTQTEIVLGRDGRVEGVGIVAGSGVVAFDVGVLDSIDRAQPFARPPRSMVVAGQVILHWEFHRNPTLGCIPLGVMVCRPSGIAL